MKSIHKRMHSLHLNSKCEAIVTSERKEIADVAFILKFKYNGTKIQYINFFDSAYNFVIQLSAEEIENINLDELGKLDPIVLQENIKNRIDYRNSVIKLFLYKRFILM